MDNFLNIFEKIMHSDEQEFIKSIRYGLIALDEAGNIFHFCGYRDKPTEKDKEGLCNELKMDDSFGLTNKIDNLIIVEAPEEVVKEYIRKIEQEETPEDVLTQKIEDEIKELTATLKGEYWFHDDVKVGEIGVLNWIEENRPEFYKKAIIEPEAVEGSDIIIDALEALGLIKKWREVEEDELRTSEEVEQWKTALGYYDEE